MIIGIIGTRQRDTPVDYLKVWEAFRHIYEDGDNIISGGCSKGGDRFAEKIARENNIPILVIPANWKRDGKVAGLMRNTLIAGKCDYLIACVSKDRKGGTEDTIKKFLRANSLPPDSERLVLV